MMSWSPSPAADRQRADGFTLVELLVALAIGGILLGGLYSLTNTAASTVRVSHSGSELAQQLNFALDRMTRTGAAARGLLLPLRDNPATNWPEHIRVQTIPASAPVGASTYASAVFAVLAPAGQDLDRNGIPDADNDGDGRIDEDLGSDATADGAAGIRGIDDDGDGSVDEGGGFAISDDDEDGAVDEDGLAYLNQDSDGDGSTDEDVSSDADLNLLPGASGVDDDGDGAVDEGGLFNSWNDDEDDRTNEDWYDPVVYYLNGGNLIERLPVPWDESGNNGINGADYVENIIASGVIAFSVERQPGNGRAELVKLSLTLGAPGSGMTRGATVAVRIGSAL